eukprot:9455575-Pyramimonas_sp.AAC.2
MELSRTILTWDPPFKQNRNVEVKPCHNVFVQWAQEPTGQAFVTFVTSSKMLKFQPAGQADMQLDCVGK